MVQQLVIFKDSRLVEKSNFVGLTVLKDQPLKDKLLELEAELVQQETVELVQEILQELEENDSYFDEAGNSFLPVSRISPFEPETVYGFELQYLTNLVINDRILDELLERSIKSVIDLRILEETITCLIWKRKHKNKLIALIEKWNNIDLNSPMLKHSYQLFYSTRYKTEVWQEHLKNKGILL